MNTYGVRKEVIVACLGFRGEMINYVGDKLASNNEVEFCAKINSIYKAFGYTVDDISSEDFFSYDVFSLTGLKDELLNKYLFPTYDGLCFRKNRVNLNRVITTMSPVWNAVRGSRDLALLLEHRNDNPVFDEVLFALIMSGAWMFGDFLKMCGDVDIIRDRIYESDCGEIYTYERFNGYPRIPCKADSSSLNKLIIKSFIGAVCAEISVDEVVKYDKCFPEIWYLMKIRREKLDFEGIMLHGAEWGRRYSDRLSCKPACNLLEASHRVENPNFRWLLQLLSLKDVTRTKVGIRHCDEYDKGTIDTKLMSWCYIPDGGLLSEMKVSEIRDGRETMVTLK